ncbi:MAG: nicotinate-nucleotide--dimethylbenzimidazole phosphoribosyltransferase [Halanaerobiales bacterium]|nr:nicotinate-nucleotide--dimethylbenzimidazole phosphoribosyltransferase [Halanaerobiales bacterium]
MELLEKTIKNIGSLDQGSMESAQTRLDNLTKPPGSLGYLEELAVKIAGITAVTLPDVSQKAHIIMVGDHGVVKEGVSAFPQTITAAMVKNFLKGGAAVNVFANQYNVDISIADIGMIEKIDDDKLIQTNIKRGTDNILKGPAMSHKEAVESIEVGIKIAEQLIDRGKNIIGTGEMGIGNTTPSSAIISVVIENSLDEIVGYGTGLDKKGLENKKAVINKALKVNKPQKDDGIDILSKVGGLEIGGMAGVMLAGAAHRKPVMIDGLISGAAALIAYLIEPDVINYLIPSHKSVEPGHDKLYQYLNLRPMFDLNMRLGEGTGAILGMGIVESSIRIIKEMATFDTLDF